MTRYAQALSFPGKQHTGNLAQIPADAWLAMQPENGCAVSLWVNIPAGGCEKGGYIYERTYDGCVPLTTVLLSLA